MRHLFLTRMLTDMQMEQKLQYARWKAADGAKALREGREPTSGPRERFWRLASHGCGADVQAIPENETNPFPELPMGSPGGASTQLQGSPGPARGSFSSLQRPVISPPPNNGSPAGSTPLISPKPSPAQNPRSNLPNLDTTSHEKLGTPGRTDSFASGAWSTVATPGVADEEGREKRFDLNRPSPPTPSAPPLDQEARSPSGDRKNVRFAGPDGAPLSPAHTHMTFDSYDAPTAPPPTTYADSPTEPKALGNGNGNSQNSSSSDPSTQSSSSRTNGSGPQQPPVPPSLTLPPPPPPSLASAPSVPPPVPQPNGLGLSSPPPSAPPAPAVSAAPPTRKQLEQTQKHAKWAISALEFDDVETARAELRKALATIGG